MPKVILEFNMPEESAALKMAQEGANMHDLLTDIENVFRKYRKYYTFKGKLDKQFFDALDDQICEILRETPEVY